MRSFRNGKQRRRQNKQQNPTNIYKVYRYRCLRRRRRRGRCFGSPRFHASIWISPLAICCAHLPFALLPFKWNAIFIKTRLNASVYLCKPANVHCIVSLFARCDDKQFKARENANETWFSEKHAAAKPFHTERLMIHSRFISNRFCWTPEQLERNLLNGDRIKWVHRARVFASQLLWWEKTKTPYS